MRKMAIAAVLMASPAILPAAANDGLLKTDSGPESMGHPDRRLREYPVFEARSDQREQRRQDRARLDVLDRRAARS